MADTTLEKPPPSRAMVRLRRLCESAFTRAFLVFLALALAYVTSAALAGELASLVDQTEVFHLHRTTRTNLVLSLILAFTLWANLTTPRYMSAAMSELLEPGGEPGLAPVHPDSWLSRNTWPAVVLGAGFGLAIVIASTHRFPDSATRTGGIQAFWNLGLMPALFGLMGQFVHISVSAARALSRIGRSYTPIRLLDPVGLRPFARCGLRLGRDWFIGSAIAMLLLFDISDGSIVAGVLAITLGLAVASLVLPALGIHQRLREIRRAELARVRASIEQRSEALFEPAGPEDPSRLPALIAYEARIQQVSEWPFDPSTLLRFCLFILIPIGSWVGGAMVERLVDAALR